MLSNILKTRVLIIASLFVYLTLSSAKASGQDSLKTTGPKYKFGIGAGAGFATGYGLSFRYWPKKFGAQANFAPFVTEDIKRYSFGITFLYSLIENKVSSLYLYQANHYYYNSQMQYVYDPSKPTQQDMQRVTEAYVNDGLGFGIEVVAAKRIGINLMAGYAFYNNFKEVNITGEAAIYYKF